MNCQETCAALHGWDPDHVDLPDAVFEHVDGCDSCREHLDTLWVPAELPPTPVDPELRERLLASVREHQQPRRRLPWGALLAAAAAAFFPMPQPSPSFDADVLLADVCSPTWPIEDICEV